VEVGRVEGGVGEWVGVARVEEVWKMGSGGEG